MDRTLPIFLHTRDFLVSIRGGSPLPPPPWINDACRHFLDPLTHEEAHTAVFVTHINLAVLSESLHAHRNDQCSQMQQSRSSRVSFCRVCLTRRPRPLLRSPSPPSHLSRGPRRHKRNCRNASFSASAGLQPGVVMPGLFAAVGQSFRGFQRGACGVALAINSEHTPTPTPRPLLLLPLRVRRTRAR